MRNAALILGIVGGLWGMLVGFFAFGYSLVVENWSELAQITGGLQDPVLVRVVSLGAPILAIAGGAMARSSHVPAGLLMLVSAAGMYLAFGFGVFTMFPIAMCGVGGLLALAARSPDPH